MISSLTKNIENVAVSRRMAMILKDHAKKAITAPITPTSPGDVFEESLKSGYCVKILFNYMQNIEKQVKELFLLAQENKEKHIKSESDLNELTKAIDLISGKSDDFEREKRQKDKIIKELKSEVPDLNTSAKNLETQLDRQE